jgi:hypothetical protein
VVLTRSSRDRAPKTDDEKRQARITYKREYQKKRLSVETEEERKTREERLKANMKKHHDKKRAARHPCKLCK